MENKYIGKICPYCKTPFNQEDTIVICNTCSMPHHLTCWQENEGCATYGCTGLIDSIINQDNAIKQMGKINSVDSSQQDKTETLNRGTVNFETIYESTDCKWQKDVPVLINKVFLIKNTTDNSLLARCSFRSLTDKSIKAILLDIVATDSWGNSVEGVEDFQLLDLKTQREADFGQTTPIPIPNTDAREIDVVIKKILYEDRNVEDCEETYYTIPIQRTLLSVLGMKEAVESYAEKTVKSAKYVPVVGQQIWRCTCGATNITGEDICYSCNTSITLQQSAYLPEEIIAETKAFLEERQRKEEAIRKAREKEQREAEERLRKAQEEKERQDREEKEAIKIKRKKRVKKVVLSLLAIFFLLGAIYGTGWHLIPFIRYNVASINVEKCKFDSAYNTYIALKNYKDCPDKAIETLYKKARYLEEQEKFIEAATEYEKIPDYEDSKEKAVYCRKEARYREGKAAYEVKNYDEAITSFSILDDYSDSKEWVLKSKYAKATDNFENKKYSEAAELFKELGNYEDSKDWMNESKYQMAETAFSNKDYKTAYISFESITPGYKDVKDKGKEAKYRYACECFSAKKYKEASDLFIVLRDYKEGQTKYNESTYAYAKACYDKQMYKNARTYFEKVKGYEDADVLWNESSYLAGIECLNDKEYQNAIIFLEDVKGYKDAKEKLNEAKYAYVCAHKNKTDSTTLLYLKQLKEVGYSDSAAIYRNLYQWYASIAINDSEYNETSILSSISRFSNIYCHVKLSGGEPNANTKISYRFIWPNGSSSSGAWDEKWDTGDSGWCKFWYNSPYYGEIGTATCNIYDENGNLIGSESITITY